MAWAWSICTMAISSPFAVTLEFRLMFCDLNGAQRYPLRRSILPRAATVMDLPASEVAPTTMMAFPRFQQASMLSLKTSIMPSWSPGAMPFSRILGNAYSTVRSRWMKRQSSHDQISPILVPLM